MERLEIRVCFELGIAFAHGKKASNCLAQHIVCLHFFFWSRSFCKGGARSDNVFKRRFFVRGIALDRLNEIGDEVASPRELRGYGLPCGVAAIRFGNDAIVECDEVSEYGNYQDKYYKCRNGERTSHGSSLGVRYICSFELD